MNLHPFSITPGRHDLTLTALPPHRIGHWSSAGRNSQQGISFYLVSALVVVSLILGIAYIYSLTSENKMITKTMISEICLNLGESAANEAYYYARKQMNRESLVFFNIFREPLAEGGSSGGAVIIPTPETDALAKEYAGAKVKSWVMFANRQLFSKNLLAKDIDPGLLDKRETMGTLRIVAYSTYKGTHKLLTIDRDVKVVNVCPPKYDFTLWVKYADKAPYNIWQSRSGAQYRNMVLLNGDDDSQKPLEMNQNGYIYLGNGRELTKDPGTGDLEEVPKYADPMGMNPGSKNPIVINLTAFEVLGEHILKKIAGKFDGLWGQLDLVKHGCPQMDLWTNIPKTKLLGTENPLGLGHTVYFECQGHDSTLEEETPVKFGFGSVTKQAAGLKYFIGKTFNQYIVQQGAPLEFLDITKSGFDLNGTDYWRGGANPPPQYARRILGNVYKSYIKLKLVNLHSVSETDPDTGGAKQKWAYCPWIYPPPADWKPSSFQLLPDPVDGSAPAKDPNMFLENSNKPIDHDGDPPISDAIASNYYKHFKTTVVKEIYDIHEEGKIKPNITYINSEIGYSDNVTNWCQTGYIPHELSWDKISKTMGSYDDFLAKSGLKKAINEPNSPPLLRLDGVWMITDFDDFKFPSHLVVYGKGTLIFVNTNVMIDGIYNLPTFKEHFKEIYAGKPFDPVPDPETRCTIVLMTFKPPGMPCDKKIHITNKLIMASLAAPDSTLGMDQAVQKDSADSNGDTSWDIDIFGNTVVERFDLRDFIDKSKESEPKTRAGGRIRYDAAMRPVMDAGQVSPLNYHVTVSKKMSFWNFADVTGQDLSGMLGE